MVAKNRALQQYYDANTSRFLLFGGSGHSRAIHRCLWEPGVLDTEQAAAAINHRIVEYWNDLNGAPPGRVRDLGCGVGGSLFHFGSAWPGAALEGITVSPRQAALARREGAARGYASRLHVSCGDFLQPVETPADLVVAVESHVHAPSAEEFLKAAVIGMAPKSKLVIVDDMLTRPESALAAADRKLIASFLRGWRLGHVPDADSLRAEADAVGLERLVDDDLTAHLRLDRWRDRALYWLAPAVDALGGNRWPLFANMIGGNALTLAYRRGLMSYRAMVFARTG